MRGKVARFLRQVVYMQEDRTPEELRRFYRRLKKDFYKASVKEKHLAYTIMLKPELLEENNAGDS